MEVHLNGGSTPSDVIVLTAWDERACNTLQPFFAKGATVMISKVYIKDHTIKSSAWVSSRHALCGTIDPSSEVRPYDGAIEWLPYHPTTAIPSLHHLPHNAFVCLAGMVLSPGPVTKSERVAGVDELVDITNFQLRAKDGIVNVEAWRDTSAYAAQVVKGRIYYFEGIKKVSTDKSNSQWCGVRYEKSTLHYPCAPDLEAALLDDTVDSTDGATLTSRAVSARSRKPVTEYKIANADWVTLSVIADIISGGELRCLEGAVQVPSVLLKPVGDRITYLCCPACGKGWYESKTCQCVISQPRIRYRAELRHVE